MTYTKHQIDALRAGITPGEWRAVDDRGNEGPRIVPGQHTHATVAAIPCDGLCNDGADAAFIAAAPAIVDQLTERVEALEAALNTIDEWLTYTSYGLAGPTLEEIVQTIQDAKRIARQALGGGEAES
jgi:hypothetical protein